MFKFLKTLFVGIVDFVVGPFMDLPKLGTKDTLARIITLLDCASRAVILASFFVAMPSALVSLAWAWIWTCLIVTFGAVVFLMGTAFGAMREEMKAAA